MYECQIITTTDMEYLVDLPTHTWNSSEQIYQYFKSDNEKWQNIIRSEKEPHKTKSLSRKLITKEYELVEKWHKDYKNYIMRLALFLKFSQNKELYEKLMNSNEELIEKNWWNDTYWGECQGRGFNFLGKYLMEIRDFGLEKFEETLK